jgi:cytochrome c-type biogenesis protein CcmE
VKKQAKFGVGISVIVASLGFLAWLGYGESKTYYHTIAELETLNSSARSQRMRVGGTVAVGSIRHLAGRVDFVLEGEGKTLPVSYIGTDPLPDTFIDKSQALVEGHTGPRDDLSPRLSRQNALPSMKLHLEEKAALRPALPNPRVGRAAGCRAPGIFGG